MKKSREELCATYKRERNNLYSKRKRLTERYRSGKISKKKYDQEFDRTEKKIIGYGSKIFKCGKRYAKLKEKRTSLVRKRRRLVNKAKDKRLSDKERNAYRTEIGKINKEIRDIEAIMGKTFELKKGKYGVTMDIGAGIVEESIPVWLAKSSINAALSGGLVKFVTLEGETYSTETDTFSLMEHIDDYITEITAAQNDNRIKTPMVNVTINLDTKIMNVN